MIHAFHQSYGLRNHQQTTAPQMALNRFVAIVMSSFIPLLIIDIVYQEEFEDTKGVIRNRISKKNRTMAKRKSTKG
jgi:hypothetical protein